MPTHTIKPNLCTNCGLCAQVCGAFVFVAGEGDVRINEDMADKCIQCGHCMAVCPTQAVQLDFLDYSQMQEIGPELCTPDALLDLMLRRRSMRSFGPDPVPRDVLQRIVDAAATAPMGIPPTGVEVTVLASREEVAAQVPVLVEQFEGLGKALSNPVGKFMVGRMMDKKTWKMVVETLMPYMEPAIERYHAEGFDFVTYDAPAMLLFHVGPDSLSGETDVVIAATYAMLMAEALGVGNIMLGLSVAAVERSKELRARYGIPEENQVMNALALGYTDRRFARTIPREMASVRWVGNG